jgi:HSP20 family molecular chaperone IbpA
MPAVDMFEGDDTNELIVKIDLPGYAKKDIRLSIDEDILRIRGQIGSEMKSCIRDLFIINIDLDR